MKTVCNKTQRPLGVPLPHGKTLHLGPRKTGQVPSSAVEHPGFRKLVDGGEIEIIGEGTGSTDVPGGGRKARTSMRGYTSGRGGRRSGDR